MLSMVSSVGSAWLDAMELSAVSIVESTARPEYKSAENLLDVLFLFFRKEVCHIVVFGILNGGSVGGNSMFVGLMLKYLGD
jgi:hypothetical protein